MATILIKGERCTVTLHELSDEADPDYDPGNDNDGEAFWYGLPSCGGEQITDRGHFEDTVQQATRHADNCPG